MDILKVKFLHENATLSFGSQLAFMIINFVFPFSYSAAENCYKFNRLIYLVYVFVNFRIMPSGI